MNLYDKASLILTPNAYKAGKMYAVKPVDGTGDFDFIRASSAMRRNSQGFWESVANNVPRLHYPVGGGCPSWLFEPQGTNTVLNSNNSFDNGTNGSSNVSSEPTNISGVNFRIMTATAVDGLINCTAGNLSTPATGVRCFSVFLKKGTCEQVQLIDQSSTGVQITVNLNNGSIISKSSSLNAGVIDDGNGIYRVWAVQDYSSIGFRWDLYAKQIGTFYYSTTQFEEGSYPTSPIITTGTAATRVTDYYEKTISPTISQGTVFIHIKDNIPLIVPGTHVYGVFTITDGSLGIYSGSINNGRVRFWTNAASNIYQTTADNAKIAITWNGSVLNVYENGIKVVTNFSYNLGNVNSILSSSALEATKAINGLYLYDTLLTDAECIALTTL